MPYSSPRYTPVVPSLTSKGDACVSKGLISLGAILDIILLVFFILLVGAIDSGKGSLEFEVPDKVLLHSLKGLTIFLFFVYFARIWPLYLRLWSLSSDSYQRIANEDLWMFLCITMLTYVAEMGFLTLSIVSLWHVIGAPKLQELAAVLLIVAALIRIGLSYWNHNKDKDFPKLARFTMAITMIGAFTVTCLAGVTLSGGSPCSDELFHKPHRYIIQASCQNASLGNPPCLLATAKVTTIPFDIVLNAPEKNVLASRVLPPETGSKHQNVTSREDSRSVIMLYEVTDMSSYPKLYNKTVVRFSCAKTHEHLCNACSEDELDQLSVSILPRKPSGHHDRCSSRKVLPLVSSWDIGYRYCESWSRASDDAGSNYVLG